MWLRSDYAGGKDMYSRIRPLAYGLLVLVAFGTCIMPALAETKARRTAPRKTLAVHARTPIRTVAQTGRTRGLHNAPTRKNSRKTSTLAGPQSSAPRQGGDLDSHPLLSVASQYVGRPYRFGAMGSAFDCSGLVHTAAAATGLSLPRSAREQFRTGTPVRRDQLQPGDLVFFRTYRRDASHVGIYAGDGKFLHAARRSGGVRVDSLDHPYYAARYLGARRLSVSPYSSAPSS